MYKVAKLGWKYQNISQSIFSKCNLTRHCLSFFTISFNLLRTDFFPHNLLTFFLVVLYFFWRINDLIFEIFYLFYYGDNTATFQQSKACINQIKAATAVHPSVAFRMHSFPSRVKGHLKNPNPPRYFLEEFDGNVQGFSKIPGTW